MNKLEKVVFLADQHVPFHDKQTHKTVLKLLRHIKPDVLYLIGDLVDFYDISRFTKDISKRFHMQKGVDGAVEVLKEYRAASPEARIIYLRGNHEKRLETYKNEHPEIADLKGMNLSEMLHLKEIGIELEHGHAIKHKGFLIVHGDNGNKFGSKHVAQNQLERWKLSGVSGHTHKKDTWTEPSKYSGDKEWNVLGCLADIEKVSSDYAPDAKWNQSIGIAHFSDNRFSFQNLSIVRHKAVFQGLVFGPE